MVSENLRLRFWEKVQKTETCWKWTAATVVGYGTLGRGGSHGGNVLAHRLSWELHYGTIPPGLYVCHHCDNRLCVRPDHLWLGTAADNMRDMEQKGRRPLGEDYERSRLTAEIVRTLRQTQTRGKGSWTKHPKSNPTYQDLADQYGVSEATIRDAVQGRTWKHVQ